jgi:hypothetical protein
MIRAFKQIAVGLVIIGWMALTGLLIISFPVIEWISIVVTVTFFGLIASWAIGGLFFPDDGPPADW